MAGIYFSDDNQTPETPGSGFGALYWDDSSKRWFQRDSLGNSIQILTSIDAGAGSGDVVGPASSTDNAIVRFDGTTGKLVQNSVVLITDTGVVSGISQLDVDNVRVDGNSVFATNTNGNLNLSGNGTGAAIVNGVTLTNTGGGTLFLANDGTYKSVGGGSGDVVGPASATDEALVRFDSTTGKLIQNSLVTLSDTGVAAGFTQLNVDNLRLDGNSLTVTDTDGNLTLTGNGTGAAIVNGVTLSNSGGGTLFLADDGTYKSVGGGSGDVVGPASATDNALARFDSTTGKLIQNSLVTIDDVGIASGFTQLNVDNLRLDGNTINVTDTNGNLNLNGNGTGAAIVNGVTLTGAGGGTLFLADDGTYKSVGGGSGDVVGPAGATDNALARFDTTTGKLIQNSVAILTDAGILSGLTQLNVDDIRIDGNTIEPTNLNGNLNLNGNGIGDAVINGVTIVGDGTGNLFLADDGSYQSIGGGGVWGTEVQSVVDEVVSSTTSTSFLTKINYVTTSLPAGTYRIQVTYFWNTSTSNRNFLSRFLIDGGLEREHEDRANTTSGTTVPGTGSGQKLPASYSLEVLLTAGTHTLELEWASQNVGSTASIWNAKIELWRVA